MLILTVTKKSKIGWDYELSWAQNTSYHMGARWAGIQVFELLSNLISALELEDKTFSGSDDPLLRRSTAGIVTHKADPLCDYDERCAWRYRCLPGDGRPLVGSNGEAVAGTFVGPMFRIPLSALPDRNTSGSLTVTTEIQLGPRCVFASSVLRNFPSYVYLVRPTM